ncbi:polyamine ABC transporter substrate-binding protein [Patulibacter defluvii]|uniref:polyamine ABC transporter substrate-binding protein n=1 Tax=Patulibacter defluvii TaxID=3095358 RepID=UPI002A758806|nr:spermidine/putrescine ABC transporter substrate-binding protein [Patulibacter sp. DM4]
MAEDRERIEGALDRFLAEDRSSRRRFLGRGAGAAFLASGLATALTACGIEGTAAISPAQLAKEAASVNHPKQKIGDWVFANWPLYMDKAVIKDFDKRYGGNCKYVEEINDNDDFFGKVRKQLAAGQPIGRDIVVLTDFMAAKWVRAGYASPIDKRNVPNAKNIVSNLKTIAYDPKREFTLPYQSGAVGLGYNIKETGRELKSLKEFFNPEWRGRVTMLNEAYDSAGTVMLMQGKDPSKAKLDDLLEAIELLSKQREKGQFRKFTGNDYTTDLAKGNVAVALVYSGDLVQLQSDNPDVRFVYAEEGSMLFTDNLMLPTKVAHPYAAETMFNYLYEPEVAAKLCAYINYLSPVDGIRPILERTDPDIAKNELIFPPDDVRARLHPYPPLTVAEEQIMKAAMSDVTGS